MTNWGTASLDYIHEHGTADPDEDVIDDDSVEITKNGSNTDAITNYDDELGKPSMNIRCVRTLRN